MAGLRDIRGDSDPGSRKKKSAKGQRLFLTAKELI